MLEVPIICTANTTVNLFDDYNNYSLFENTMSQSGYIFSKNGEWKFYEIDEAQNRHIFDWYGLPSEGVYELSQDTIWLFQRVDNQWEKRRGLLVLQATNLELTVRLLDRLDDDWCLTDFDVHLKRLNDDTINILNSEQWAQTWEPIYQKQSVLIECSFQECTLNNKKIKEIIRNFVEETKNIVPDTTNISIEMYLAKRKGNVCLIANSLFTFSGKNIWGVVGDMEMPVFILDNDMNSCLFTKQSSTITYSICMEETKYKNGVTSHDLCEDYLSELPIKSICIPLSTWK